MTMVQKKYLNKIASLVVLIIFVGSLANNAVGIDAPLSSASDSTLSEIASPKAPTNTQNSTDPISLDLRGVEITQLFKVLSQRLNINIVPSKNVTGRVSLFLNNIPPEQILDIITVTQDLAFEKINANVIIVSTQAEYEAKYGKKFNEQKKSLTLKAQYIQPQLLYNALINIKSTVGNIILDAQTGTLILIDIPEKLEEMEKVFKSLDQPIITKVFELQYGIVEDLEADVTSLISEGTGTVISDERTNSFIIKDLPGNMDKISQAIAMLDQETKQVLIQAEIIEIKLEDDLHTGIEWEKIMNNPSIFGTVLTGSFPATTALSSYLNLTMGGIANGHEFELTLNFLNTLGDLRVLSRPRIAVTNNEEATIHVGSREVAISGTTSQSGESVVTSDSWEYIDTGIMLAVVPTINRDGFITMKIKPEITTVTGTVTTGETGEPRSIIPIIDTSEAETTVKIKDGSMIMIAGLRKTTDDLDINGIPFLSELPIIGALFGSRDSEKEVKEIIIFIKANIIRGDKMLSWDIEKLDQFPDFVHPENKGYLPPKTSILRKLRKKREV